MTNKKNNSNTLKEINFSSNLEKLLKERKVTQQMLADILGVSRITVTNYINGSKMPRIEKVIEISLVFEVVVDSLFA